MERPSLTQITLCKKERTVWQARAKRMESLYTELLPFLTGNDPAMTAARDDLRDLVPNTLQNLGIFLRNRNQYALERLLDHFAPMTPERMANVEAVLREQIADPEVRHHARRVADDLEWCMRETYEAAEKLLPPQTTVSDIDRTYHIYRKANTTTPLR